MFTLVLPCNNPPYDLVFVASERRTTNVSRIIYRFKIQYTYRFHSTYDIDCRFLSKSFPLPRPKNNINSRVLCALNGSGFFYLHKNNTNYSCYFIFSELYIDRDFQCVFNAYSVLVCNSSSSRP